MKVCNILEEKQFDISYGSCLSVVKVKRCMCIVPHCCFFYLLYVITFENKRKRFASNSVGENHVVHINQKCIIEFRQMLYMFNSLNQYIIHLKQTKCWDVLYYLKGYDTRDTDTYRITKISTLSSLIISKPDKTWWNE